MERLNNKQTIFITEHIKDSSEVTHHVTSTLGFPLQRDLCLNFKKADKSLCSKKQNSLCVRTSEESFPRGSETRERGENSRLGGDFRREDWVHSHEKWRQCQEVCQRLDEFDERGRRFIGEKFPGKLSTSL